MHYPTTPDGRYFAHNGILWRTTNPDLPETERKRFTTDLMSARRDVGTAKRSGDKAAEKEARSRVHEAKVALGERGPAWWTDGAPDYNRHAPKNTPYADWYASLPEGADVPKR